MDKAPTKETPEERYLILYPESLILSSKENICVKLFNGFTIDEFDVDIFDSSKRKEPHLFDNAPIASARKLSTAGSRNICLEVTVPEFAKGERAVVKFRLKSQVK